jgi:hypothetical protein
MLSRIGENMVLMHNNETTTNHTNTKSDEDDTNKDEQGSVMGAAALTTAILAALFVFLITTLCSYVAFRYRHAFDGVCQRPKKMKLAYWRSNGRCFWKHLEGDDGDYYDKSHQLSPSLLMVTATTIMLSTMPIDQVHNTTHHHQAVSVYWT